MFQDSDVLGPCRKSVVGVWQVSAHSSYVGDIAVCREHEKGLNELRHSAAGLKSGMRFARLPDSTKQEDLKNENRK